MKNETNLIKVEVEVEVNVLKLSYYYLRYLTNKKCNIYFNNAS